MAGYDAEIVANKFQFLIGSLETKELYNIFMMKASFNSL